MDAFPQHEQFGISGPLGNAVFDSGPRNRGAYGGLGYAVDVVFVIDITASMGPVLNAVKRSAIGFHTHLVAAMSAKSKFISKLRVRVVAFRDFYDFPDDALTETPFYEIPEQNQEFGRFISCLTPDGGGDEPESGLEALAVAMASQWEHGMDRRRHVIVLCTDASSHPLERSHDYSVPKYPNAIPRSLDDLSDAWCDPDSTMMDHAAKRLILYAPDVYPWNVISRYWDAVLHIQTEAGRGLDNINLAHVIDAIAGSI